MTRPHAWDREAGPAVNLTIHTVAHTVTVWQWLEDTAGPTLGGLRAAWWLLRGLSACLLPVPTPTHDTEGNHHG
jgi:hypothetical protein